MIYTHINMDELVMIEYYCHQNVPVAKTATYLNCSRTPICNVVNFLKAGHTAFKYYLRYKENKKQRERSKFVLSQEQRHYDK